MSEVVLGVPPPVHAASQANKAAMGVSTTALDTKLDRVETGGAAALVRDSALLAEPVVKAVRASHPRWGPGSQITVLDGHHVSSTEHRLKAWRGTWAAPFPGQALVVCDQQRLGITEVVRSEEGHAQERRMIAQGLQHVEADQRWIEDRTCCTGGLMVGMAQRDAACVVRQHGQVQGALRGRATRTGTTRRGPVSEHALGLRDPPSGETMRGRRITITLKVPTRDGDTARHLLATVPVHRASAAQLARLSGKRWRIATAFCALTTTLSCEIKTLGYPTAAWWTFCLALFASNAVWLITAALRSAPGRQKVHDEVAGSYLSVEMSRTDDGMMLAMPAPYWACFRDLSAQAFAEVLREFASSVTLSR